MQSVRVFVCAIRVHMYNTRTHDFVYVCIRCVGMFECDVQSTGCGNMGGPR